MQTGPRVVLVQAPAFVGRGPSNAIALLSAHLKAAGFAPAVCDASLGARLALARRLGRERPLHFDYPEDFMGALLRPRRFFGRVMDAQAAEILSHAPDIVGFSVLQATEESSLALAERVKKRAPKTFVVLGGPQCLRETMAGELLGHETVDAVALGEADKSIVELARKFDRRAGRPRGPIKGLLLKEAGRIVDGGEPEEIRDLDTLPFMDFSGFDLSQYDLERLFLNGSRGCVRACAFCTHILQQKVYRRMSPERIAAEIRHQLGLYPERYYIEFGDSLVNGDVRRLSRLSRLLAPIRLERASARRRHDFGWGGMAILHPTMTPALLRELRWGGCQMLAYGMESASQRVIDLIGKNFKVSDAERVIRDTEAAGIRVKLFLMVGFPGETEEDFRLTLEFLRRHSGLVDKVAISCCEITKGSFLDAHRREFGVAQPLTDRRRWSTRDGFNTYEVRRGRYQALHACAMRHGIDVERKPRQIQFEPSGFAVA